MRIRWAGFALLTSVVAGFLAFPSAAKGAEAFGRAIAFGSGRAGEVHGRVTLNLPAPSAPAMLSPYARRRYTPPTPASEASRTPQSVVVYIMVAGRSPSPGAAEAVIRQRNRTISPTVTVVQKGTRIQFPNDDNVYHNLFSLSSTRPFNLGRYAPGASRALLFDKAGVVRMFCDIHSEMSGTILVLDTPFFTRPDAEGDFVIRGVPEGRHTLFAWHESTGAVTSSIVVRGDGVTRADIRLPN